MKQKESAATALLHRLNENAELNEIGKRNVAPLSGYVDTYNERGSKILFSAGA